jgi:uncharacterized protein YjeT (DUF2065 family)
VSFLNTLETLAVQIIKTHNLSKLNMTQFILGSLGMLLIIEGLLYALFPSRMKAMITSMLNMENDKLKWGGLMSAILGFIMLWSVIE